MLIAFLIWLVIVALVLMFLKGASIASGEDDG